MKKENMGKQSLWMLCFWEVYNSDKMSGKKMLEFSDVDKLVIEKSHMGIEDLINYLKKGNES